mgnify:CR=1 FL=1
MRDDEDDHLPRLGRVVDRDQDKERAEKTIEITTERERKPLLYLPNGRPLVRRLGF